MAVEGENKRSPQQHSFASHSLKLSLHHLSTNSLPLLSAPSVAMAAPSPAEAEAGAAVVVAIVAVSASPPLTRATLAFTLRLPFAFFVSAEGAAAAARRRDAAAAVVVAAAALFGAIANEDGGIEGEKQESSFRLTGLRRE